MSAVKLEDRVRALEKEVARLKRQLAANGAGDNWLTKVTGSFKGDPDFDEILKLGREIRRKLRPRGRSSEAS